MINHNKKTLWMLAGGEMQIPTAYYAKKEGYKIARIPYWLTKKEEEIEIDNILAGKPTYPDVPDLKHFKISLVPVIPFLICFLQMYFFLIFSINGFKKILFNGL